MWPTSPEWKATVLERMRELGISRAELSRRVRVSDAAITNLFDPHQPTSRLVPAVNQVVGLPPPSMSVVGVDAYRSQLDAVWPNLGEDDRKLLLDMAIKIAERKK